MDGIYMPYPCKEECFEPLKWPHILSTFDIYVNPKPIKFCTLESYDIQPLLMLTSTYTGLDDQSIEPQFYCQDQVSIEDVPLTMYSSIEDGDHEDCLEPSDIDGDIDGEYDFVVPKLELEKVCLLLKGREAVSVSISRDQPQCKFCQSHCKFCKQMLKSKREAQKAQLQAKERESKPLEFPKSSKYLLYVKAIDCIKEHKRSFYVLNEESLQSKDQTNKSRKCKKMKIPKVDLVNSKASKAIILSKTRKKSSNLEEKMSSQGCMVILE